MLTPQQDSHVRGVTNLASGIVNTSYQIGSALGLTVMTAVAAANRADRLGKADALTDGFSADFVGAAIVAATGALSAVALFRRSASGATSEQNYDDQVVAWTEQPGRPAADARATRPAHRTEGTTRTVDPRTAPPGRRRVRDG